MTRSGHGRPIGAKGIFFLAGCRVLPANHVYPIRNPVESSGFHQNHDRGMNMGRVLTHVSLATVLAAGVLAYLAKPVSSRVEALAEKWEQATV